MNPHALPDEEIRRLAEVAVRESEGQSVLTDWQSAALKVCRAILAQSSDPASLGVDMRDTDLSDRFGWVRVYRQRTGCGLKEGIDAYDRVLGLTQAKRAGAR